MTGGPVQRIIASPGRQVAGRLRVPGDKSISHRALMLGAIAEGQTRISGFLAGEDCLATMAALRQLGVTIDATDIDRIVVNGVGLHGLQPPAAELDMGNSGTGMRLLAGILAGQPFESVLTGDASLRQRPMERIAAPLRAMGATVQTSDGRPPLTVRGGLLSALDYASPVASAQVKSAILLAGLYATGTTRVTEPGISRDHTERMLRTFGVQAEGGDRVATVVGPAVLQGCDVAVPGDLSSAAFVLGAGCLSAGDGIHIEQVGVNPTRTGVLDVLALMGAECEQLDSGLSGAEPVATLHVRPSRLRGAEIPPELIPLAIDEMPLIFALAACAEGTTVIHGAAELRHKESDRIAVMARGLRELGIAVDELPDGAVIHGGRLRGGIVDSAGDHRVAMAFCVAAMVAEAPVTILDTANVATSFPGFVARMQSLGMRVRHG
jgi:3-phosphoshikimate 1-carboxyvinyltransferase